MIDTVLTSLESSTSSGFLPSHDLRKFPIISEFLHPFLQSVEELGVQEYVCGRKSMESYKWIYNIILLNLYLVCLESLQKTEVNPSNVDIVTDLISKERALYGSLDPSIRHYIVKRGISIKENTYIGFDTEFTITDSGLNQLVSAQLAVTTKSYVKIPKISSYKISQLDEESNKVINLNTTSSVLNYPKIETSIKMCIDEVRRIKYTTQDMKMLVLTEGMKMIKGIRYTELEDHFVFTLPRSLIQPYIHYGTTFSLQELLRISSGIAKPYHTKTNTALMQLIEEISSSELNYLVGKEQLESEILQKYSDYPGIIQLEAGFGQRLPLQESTELKELKEEKGEKKLSREYIIDLFPQKVSVTRSRTYYLIAHLTPADLSMLSDFEDLKDDLSIVNGSFVTLGKPIKFCGKNLQIRDTMLLAPGGGRSLAAIGRLYGGVLNKVEISQEDLEDMQGFLARDKEKFTEYALRDAIISLIHASWMEDFNFQIGVVGIPLSLSSVGRSYVKYLWREDNYKGYQISNKYLLGDVSSSITPKGLNVIKDIGFVLAYYTSNYKGGRNECFMYGLDRETEWFDYDLTNAYTTVMSMAGHPDYESCIRLSKTALEAMSNTEILFSYLIIHADFEFPVDTKYPSIPCYVDENCTVYPLRGRCVITGSEYLLATSQECNFKLLDIYYTPFHKSEYKDSKPFNSIVKLVQEQRREHAKGTISNLMYKEIGNSIYGSVVRGIGNKRRYDIKSKGTVRMLGDELTNPLIASWTTAFVRSVIGECLHSIKVLGGLVVSVTTDGFICNVQDLESKISENFLFSEFKNIRMMLSDNNTALELKSGGKGIIAWTTRGQLGLESKIIATTGIQHRVFDGKDQMLKGFISIFKSENKTIEYVQGRLRSASDIYKKGGHVTMVRRDQLFRMHFDNRRILEWETSIPPTIENLIDSKPMEDIDQAKNLRFIARMSKNKQYSKYSNSGKSVNKYVNSSEIAVRNFLKGLLSTPPMFNLSRGDFYTYGSIVEYIKDFDPKIKINEVSVSLIQQRVKLYKWLPLKKNKESEVFVKYIQQKFKDFDVEAYYGLKE